MDSMVPAFCIPGCICDATVCWGFQNPLVLRPSNDDKAGLSTWTQMARQLILPDPQAKSYGRKLPLLQIAWVTIRKLYVMWSSCHVNSPLHHGAYPRQHQAAALNRFPDFWGLIGTSAEPQLLIPWPSGSYREILTNLRMILAYMKIYIPLYFYRSFPSWELTSHIPYQKKTRHFWR